MGQRQNISVGRLKATQNPRYFSAYTIDVPPRREPTLIIR